MSFKDAKTAVLRALKDGTYQHEIRSGPDEKNLLRIGAVTAEEVCEVVVKCNGNHHKMSPHHADGTVIVHVLRPKGWYVKFYILEPDAIFISVHK